MNSRASEREIALTVPLTKVPRHVGIIMDGNGRWAQARGLPRAAGHRAGIENLRQVLTAAIDFGISVVSIFAFSTENWSRPDTEVRALMGLFDQFFDREMRELHKNGVQIRHLGRTQGLSQRMVERIRRAEELTQNNDRLVLNVAFNYGGRADILDAIRKIVAEGIPPDHIDENVIADHLSTAGLPDPDLVIRTGGDMRLSNFLIWQASYAEYYCTPIYWPDFDRDALYEALLAYQGRERRFGGLRKQP